METYHKSHHVVPMFVLEIQSFPWWVNPCQSQSSLVVPGKTMINPFEILVFGGFFIPFFRPKKAEFSITRDPAQVVSGTSPINAHGTECFSSNGGISESGPAGKPSDGWLNVDNGDDLDVHGWLNVDNVDNGDWIILVMFLLLGIWLLFIFLQGRFWTASSRFFWWSGDRFLVSWGFDLSKLLWSIVEYSLWSFYSHVRHVSHVCICGQLRLMMTVFQLSRAWIHMKSVHSPCWKSGSQ